MGWSDPLKLLVSAESVFDVFETGTKKEIAEYCLFDVATETIKDRA